MVAMRDSSGAARAVGRFAGWEPLGFEAGDNNWYRFVANGPTDKTDPSGHIVWVPVIIGIGLGVFWTTNPANAPAVGDPAYPPDDTGFCGGVMVGAASGVGQLATRGSAATQLGIGAQAVVAPGLSSGAYPALLINGTVYVARFHDIAWRMAGRAEPVAKYGIAIIDATGKVVGWL